MKKYKIKLPQAQEVMILKDTLELRDDVVIKTIHEYNSNPTCNMEVDSQCFGGENVYYFDDNEETYSKGFLDMYYKEIE